METWAHGQDIADTLGVTRAPTARLRHVAHLGVSTFAFTHTLHGLDTPAEPVRVELEAPDGAHWTWGAPDAADRVTGTALDFCLVVTQRRHLDDTALRVTGSTARGWLAIAQAYAGRAGEGRTPDSSARRPEPGHDRATTGPDRELLRLLRRPARPPPGRWSTAARSTCSPATTWPS